KQRNLLAGPTLFNLLWQTASAGECFTDPQGDPIVLYDPLADRWLLSQMTSHAFHLCLAVSMTADPTQGYYLYEFDAHGPDYALGSLDYFKLGVWPDGYYMSSNPRL